MMRLVSADEVAAALPYAALCDRLDEAFRAAVEVPTRHHHTIALDGARDATLLLMPAWRKGGSIGIKMVTVFPDNPLKGRPTIMGTYTLLDGTSGEPVALIDAPSLTARRTAAASALAARRLARPDAARLVVVGTGTLSTHMAHAHASVRQLTDIAIWGRHAEKVGAVVAALKDEGLPARPAGELAEEVGKADIVSTVTTTSTPLVLGRWLAPGGHLDLVGGFTPAMRETDDDAIRRATVFVDTRAGATKEAGDIVQPIASGVIAAGDIAADLFDLASGRHPGRRSPDEITLFKSVGTAIEDLAAAELVVERLQALT